MNNPLMIVGMMLAANLTAQACDCVSPPVDKAFEKAAAVFVGTVQQVKREEQSAVNIVTLTVEQAWKGIAADQKTVTVQTASSGKACGYEFQEKVSYLVYAYGEGKSLRTGECSRTKPLANAEEDLVFLTGDAATAKKIRSTAVPPPAPAPQAPTPAPPGLTVSLQDNGQAVAAVHTSGKTIWQVKLPAPATAARVEGNRVFVEPSGLVLARLTGVKSLKSRIAALTGWFYSPSFLTRVRPATPQGFRLKRRPAEFRNSWASDPSTGKATSKDRKSNEEATEHEETTDDRWDDVGGGNRAGLGGGAGTTGDRRDEPARHDRVGRGRGWRAGRTRAAGRNAGRRLGERTRLVLLSKMRTRRLWSRCEPDGGCPETGLCGLRRAETVERDLCRRQTDADGTACQEFGQGGAKCL
jgi:hypothetical protein